MKMSSSKISNRANAKNKIASETSGKDSRKRRSNIKEQPSKKLKLSCDQKPDSSNKVNRLTSKTKALSGQECTLSENQNSNPVKNEKKKAPTVFGLSGSENNPTKTQSLIVSNPEQRFTNSTKTNSSNIKKSRKSTQPNSLDSSQSLRVSNSEQRSINSSKNNPVEIKNYQKSTQSIVSGPSDKLDLPFKSNTSGKKKVASSSVSGVSPAQTNPANAKKVKSSSKSGSSASNNPNNAKKTRKSAHSSVVRSSSQVNQSNVSKAETCKLQIELKSCVDECIKFGNKTPKLESNAPSIQKDSTGTEDSGINESQEQKTVETKLTKPKFDPGDPSIDFVEDFLVPLLNNGEEESLYQWMADFNLLKKPEKCASENCGSSKVELAMTGVGFSKAVWRCTDCKKSTNLRIGSFFQNIMCSIQDIFYCILAWCAQQHLEDFQKTHGMKEQLVRRIYSQCSEVVESYMSKNSYDWVLGGVGSVALLDVWPNGYINIPSSREIGHYQRRVKVLWLADTNCVPVRYWVHLLPPMQPLSQLLTPEYKQYVEECAKLKISEISGAVKLSPKKVLGSPDSREKRLKRRGVLKEQQEIQELIQNNEELSLPHTEYEIDRNMINSKSGTVEPKDESLMEENNIQESDEQMPKKEKISLHEEFKISARIKNLLLKEQEDYCRKRELCDAVLSAIEQRIAPGSLVVVNDKALPDMCSLLRASGKYEAVMSLQQILEADVNKDKSITRIMDNIWKTASIMCSDWRALTRCNLLNKIAFYQWQQMFGSQTSKAVYSLLCQIASSFIPPSAKPKMHPLFRTAEH